MGGFRCGPYSVSAAQSMLDRSHILWIKIGFAVGAVLLAVLRLAFFDGLGQRIDMTFLALFGVAFLALVVPWDRLQSLKAGSVELTLETPQVQGALQGLGLDRIESKDLRNALSKLSNEIALAKGSRVLWIDDKPHNVVGARRLFRSLGVEVLTAISSDSAEEIMQTDNDFDLIISDVQRKGENYRLNEGIEIHDGVNFVVKLRQHDDVVIQSLPVVFYAAYEWRRLVEYTRPARELQPEAEITNSIDGLMKKAFTALATARSNPIVVPTKKRPTSVAR